MARDLVAAHPDDPLPPCLLGAIHCARGRFDDAVVRYRDALAIAPGYADAHGNLGDALMALQRPAEAVDSYRQAATLNPGDAVTLYRLGAALQAAGRPEEAAGRYRDAARLRPGDADIRLALGNALVAAGDLDAAIASYREAVALAPDSAGARNNLGVALKAAGRLEDAAACFLAAHASDPEHTGALVNFADISAGIVPAFADPGLAADALVPLIRCFEHPEVDSAVVSAASQAVLLEALPDHCPPGEPVGRVVADIGAGERDLLVAHLRNAVVADPVLEALLTEIRAGYLFGAVDPGGDAADAGPPDVLAALAHQSFLNEYVWDESAAERAAVETLEARVRDAIRAGTAPAATDLVVLAAYRPLAGNPDIRGWAERTDAGGAQGAAAHG